MTEYVAASPPDMHEVFRRLTEREGTLLGVTSEFSLSQYDFDVYGALVEDVDPIHNDPEWENALRQWGGPIAIGTHLLGMTPAFLREVGLPIGSPQLTFDLRGATRVRFISPLRVDEHARADVYLLKVRHVGIGWEVGTAISVKPLDDGRPFMSAELDCLFELERLEP
jgi:acyl dehydratase